MLLVPSISVHQGKLARVSKGNYTSGKVIYDLTPIDATKQFEEAGTALLHFVDLDGAYEGSPVNDHILELVTGYTSMNVNFAGGVHTDGDISKVLERGASSVTCATMSVYRPELFTSWIMSYGRERLVLAADALDGFIRVGGWQKATKIKLFDHIAHFHQRGLKYLKTTDINREGTLEGPSFSLYEEMTKEFPDIHIFASGGIRHMDDIMRLSDLGLEGVIFGRAFYEGTITLKDIESFNALV